MYNYQTVVISLAIMLCGFSGVVLAFIEKTLYDNGVLVNALSTMGVTLTEAMTLTVIVWLVVGSIIGLMRA